MHHFLVLVKDRPDALADRQAYRDEHIAYWNDQPGVVKVAGAILDQGNPVGSSFLIEARDDETVRNLLANDPFTKHSVFSGAPEILNIRPAIGEWLPKP